VTDGVPGATDSVVAARPARVALPRLGFGGGSAFGAQADAAVHDLIEYAYARGFRYFDTAPFYGHGLSEHRLGGALRLHGRSELTLST
jgi:D-threo-aldose 1-dehydrogenase